MKESQEERPLFYRLLDRVISKQLISGPDICRSALEEAYLVGLVLRGGIENGEVHVGHQLYDYKCYQN